MPIRILSYFIILLTIVAVSCDSDTDDYVIIETGVDYDLHTIERFDGQLYTTGGDVWNRSDLAISMDGVSWQVDSMTNKSLFDLHATSDHIYGVGTDGYIFRSEPDLTLKRTRYWGMLRGFTDAEEGFVAVGGKDFNKGWIYKVGTGLDVDTTYNYAHEINHVDCYGSDCIAVGFGIILYSNDNGDTWIQTEQTGDHYRSVAYNNIGVAYVVGSAGSLLMTDDHGRTWSTIGDGHSPLGSNRPYRMIKFFDSVGVIVGDGGTMIRSDDNGLTWNKNSLATELDLYDVSFFDQSFFMASEAGRVIKTQ